MKKYFSTVITIILCTSHVFSQAPDSSLMKPAVFDWNNIKVEPAKTGEKRQILNSSTPTMANLECHVTTLNPGETAHAPHQHPEDDAPDRHFYKQQYHRLRLAVSACCSMNSFASLKIDIENSINEYRT